MKLREGLPKELYMIWNIEHDAWLKPVGNGYTKHADEAGDFAREEAFQILRSANLGVSDRPKEVLVPVFFE